MVSADAHQRFGAAVRDAAKHRRKFLITHRPMLGIDQQPVVTAVRKLFGDSGAVSVEEQAHLGRSSTQLLLEFETVESGVGHTVVLLKVGEVASLSQGIDCRENRN